MLRYLLCSDTWARPKEIWALAQHYHPGKVLTGFSLAESDGCALYSKDWRECCYEDADERWPLRRSRNYNHKKLHLKRDQTPEDGREASLPCIELHVSNWRVQQPAGRVVSKAQTRHHA